MKQIVVRYRTKPTSTDENTRLIKQVFDELRQGAPKEVRYMVLRLDDGSFLHIVLDEAADNINPLSQMAAFRAFQSGIKDRLAEGPQSNGVTIVGNYRMLAEDIEKRRPNAA
jgi:hypothetical protein